VVWGYGLHPHNLGDEIDKPMLECTGAEILTELAHQLGLVEESHLAGAQCIPCLMPYITTQFMPRSPGDRPAVVPSGAKNFAFIGQFCELPDDTVFTVEYSVRTAQVAVFEACGAAHSVTPLYLGLMQPRVIISALRTLLRNGRVSEQKPESSP
jgi:oleate hydratase